jgi:hypothetical protein
MPQSKDLPIHIYIDHELRLATSMPFYAFKVFDIIVDQYTAAGDKVHVKMMDTSGLNAHLIQETFTN